MVSDLQPMCVSVCLWASAVRLFLQSRESLTFGIMRDVLPAATQAAQNLRDFKRLKILPPARQ
jgi:hypothetical protein